MKFQKFQQFLKCCHPLKRLLYFLCLLCLTQLKNESDFFVNLYTFFYSLVLQIPIILFQLCYSSTWLFWGPENVSRISFFFHFQLLQFTWPVSTRWSLSSLLSELWWTFFFYLFLWGAKLRLREDERWSAMSWDGVHCSCSSFLFSLSSSPHCCGWGLSCSYPLIFLMTESAFFFHLFRVSVSLRFYRPCEGATRQCWCLLLCSFFSLDHSNSQNVAKKNHVKCKMWMSNIVVSRSCLNFAKFLLIIFEKRPKREYRRIFEFFPTHLSFF